MNASPPDAETLCHEFALGGPLGPMAAVVGGFSHRLWRLPTEGGVVAIKQLNPNVAARAGALDRFRASEQVAAAFSAAGVRAVVARDADAEPLRQVGRSWFLAYPWVEGTPVRLSRVTAEHARLVGGILGVLHQRNLVHGDLPHPGTRSISPEDWRALATRSEGQAWSAELNDAMPVLLALSAESTAAADALRESPTLVSHRDLVPENVIWDADGAWVIDWESAAWINPMVELVSAAIDWSGYIEGRSDRAIFDAVLDGYRAVAPLDAAEAALALPLSAASWLRWLAYNIGRALRESASDDHERSLGVSQTALSLRALSMLSRHQPLWRQWLASAGTRAG